MLYDMWQNESGLKVYSGVCPDPECRTKLYFPSYAASSVECTGCGQHHDKASLLDVEDVEDPQVALRSLIRSVVLGHAASKTSAEYVKVKGFSNYHCKLLSPFLTLYGMDKKTGRARLLKEMAQGEMFHCAVLGGRSFEVEPEHLDTAGYGRDKSGSVKYLKETLDAIKVANEDEERLVPLHVDGDGHCLVHALSRGLVGREIFWHALRANLKCHLETEILKYRGVFHDFIDEKEWMEIICEADPNFQPSEGQGHGLRNIHVFVLANVLHRPIILLDSISGMQSSGDYSGIFLPALIPVEQCKSKDGQLNKPLAIAWSSQGRNHFVPLVGVKTRKPPKLPQWVLPKAWGIPNELIHQYIEFDSQGNCVIGGSRSLQDGYLQRLVKAMDDVFFETHQIAASLVTEVHQFVYKPSGLVGILPEMVTQAAFAAVQEGRLHRCLECSVLAELNPVVSQQLLQKGGQFYDAAIQMYGVLQDGMKYSFPSHQGLVCVYDAQWDVLVPVNQKESENLKCHYCHSGSCRRVRSDGSVVYMNGDRTSTPVSRASRCGCGFKHFWDGRQYDNLPEAFPITLEWAGQSVHETVYWFQHEPNPEANSNVYDVATRLVQKHFPGEFGSERLVQKVVDIILRRTASKDGENKGAAPKGTAAAANVPAESDPAVRPFTPSKIILTGEKKKTFHREELTASATEQVLKKRTEHHAAVMQKRKSKEAARQSAEGSGKLAREQGKQERPATGSTKPTSSPQPPAASPRKSPQPVERTDKKLRLSSSDGRQCMLSLPLDTTFSSLQEAIEKELGIPPAQQKIRYGFPPRELLPPDPDHQDEPVPLQHGDRVTVDCLRPAVDTSLPAADTSLPAADTSLPAEEPSDVAGNRSDEEQQQALKSALMNALGALTADHWETAQHCPEMFAPGGLYFDFVVRELGPLNDNQHCTLAFFPKKVFAYNASQDRLDLCLGQLHVQVQPLTQEMLLQALGSALQQSNTQSAGARHTSHVTSEASFSGAIMHKDTSHSRTAFSGAGRTLAGPKQQPSEERAKEEFSSKSGEQLLSGETENAASGSTTSETVSHDTDHCETAGQDSSVIEGTSSADDVEMRLGLIDSRDRVAQETSAGGEGASPGADNPQRSGVTVAGTQAPMETDSGQEPGADRMEPSADGKEPGADRMEPGADREEPGARDDGAVENAESKSKMDVECRKPAPPVDEVPRTLHAEAAGEPDQPTSPQSVPMELDSQAAGTAIGSSVAASDKPADVVDATPRGQSTA